MHLPPIMTGDDTYSFNISEGGGSLVTSSAAITLPFLPFSVVEKPMNEITIIYVHPVTLVKTKETIDESSQLHPHNASTQQY